MEYFTKQKYTMAENENKSTPATAGTSLMSVLQIIFIVLKLTDNKVIGQWPWWKVMLPLIVSTSLCLFLCCCGACCICVGVTFDKSPKNDNVMVEVRAHPVVIATPRPVVSFADIESSG